MGLMDIGQNNPYARINPFAAVISEGLKGYQTESARIEEEAKNKIAQQQQAMLMKMKQDEADRLTKQAEAEAVAKGQLQERMLGKQMSIPASQMRPQGLLGDIIAQSPVPQEPFMYRDEKTASPMNQQELLNFSLAHSGTQAGKDALEQVKIMIKDNPNEFYQKLIASGKYTPESVAEFAAGKGKLQFAKDPSVVTWSEPFKTEIGGKKALVQYSSTGEWKPVLEDKSTTVVVGGGNSPLQQSAFVDPNTGVPLVYDKTKGSFRPATIEGGGAATPKPAAWTPETAAKVALLDNSAKAVGEAKKLLYNKDGKVNRGNVANAAARTWFTDGRLLDTKIKTAVEGVLRAESGAAVPEPEVARAAARFTPQVGDDNATISSKVAALNDFIENSRTRIQQGRIKPPGSDKGGSSIPQGAIDQLKANPKLAVYFDQKYGKGASKQYLGR